MAKSKESIHSSMGLRAQAGTSPLQILLLIITFTLLTYCVDMVRTKYYSARLQSIVELAVIASSKHIMSDADNKPLQLFQELIRNKGTDFADYTTVESWRDVILDPIKVEKDGIVTLNFVAKYKLKTFFMGLYGFREVDLTTSTKLRYSGMQNAVSISTGTGLTCAIDINNDAWCWGRKRNLPELYSDTIPFKVMLPGATKMREVFVNGEHACGITIGKSPSENQVYCWNNAVQPINFKGELHSYPELDGSIDMIASVNTNCVLRYDGNVFCWAANGYNGELGDGTTFAEGTSPYYFWPPHQVTISNIKEIDGGTYHMCAVNTSDEVYCWGDDLKGAMGVGLFERYTGNYAADTALLKYISADRPNLLSGFGQLLPDGPLTEVDASGTHGAVLKVKKLVFGPLHRSMALTADGSVYGWGLNDRWQLRYVNPPDGYATWVDKPKTSSPRKLDDAPPTSEIINSTGVTCLKTISDDHNLICAGGGASGLLGQGGFGGYGPGSFVKPENPWITVKGYWVGDIKAIGASADESICIIDETLTPWCWGLNTSGALGYGDPLDPPNSSASGTPRPILRSKILYGI
jgi:alpha-tubulin suppressor-like RCC1 family protein